MRLDGDEISALQRKTEWDHQQWPIAGPLLDSVGVDAPLSQQFSAVPSATADTLAERTYARLRYALIVGQFAPGECITLGALARQLGTSVTPVRDALSRLAAADALHQNRQSGVVVPLLSRPDLDELCRLRLAIEGFAFANAAPRHRVSDWRVFKVLHADLCRAAERDDPVRFAAAVWSVRAAILGLVRSSMLAMLVDRIWCRLGPTFTHMAADIARRRHISCHLGAIVAAIGGRDLDQARRAVADEIAIGTVPACSANVDEQPAPSLVPIVAIAGRKGTSHSESGADHV
ncbi:GntR family transcriptional regulator [Bradyrhizobium sp.]|uniref:GntR family transcriptional regulator n=1 Tax=Bradyrhizobium sp. TaxID=376 RepID=UPI003C63EEB4